MKKAQQQLAEAVRRRDEFLAMLSHELRNPLGAILNATHVMERHEVEDTMVRSTIDVVQRQGRQMSRLLDDLLDVSRVTQNKIELHMQPTNLQSIVENAIDAVRPLVDSAELTFTKEVPDDQLLVYGDEARLQQALSNLLSNAVRYTPTGGEVSLEVGSDNGEIVFTVSDNGVGIRKEELDRIFDLFVQSNHTLHRSDGGMGIGLTLVRSIVEMHNGRVTVESEGSGKGSKFEIRLPRLAAHNDEATDDEELGTAESPLLGSGNGSGRVVIVEDQDDARNMLRALLELEGYEVHEADNGTKGLTVIEHIHPDIALIDIGLPGLDGYEVVRQLRKNLGNNHTYLVALTGYGQQSDVEAALQAGFDNHLVKPLDPHKLSRILKSHGPANEKSVF